MCKARHERRRDSWDSPNPAPNGQQAAPFGAAFLIWGSLMWHICDIYVISASKCLTAPIFLKTAPSFWVVTAPAPDEISSKPATFCRLGSRLTCQCPRFQRFFCIARQSLPVTVGLPDASLPDNFPFPTLISLCQSCLVTPVLPLHYQIVCIKW